MHHSTLSIECFVNFQDICLVVTVFNLDACDLNLFDQLLFIGIDRIQFIHHAEAVFFSVGRGIAERTHRVQKGQSLFCFIGVVVSGFLRTFVSDGLLFLR